MSLLGVELWWCLLDKSGGACGILVSELGVP